MNEKFGSNRFFRSHSSLFESTEKSSRPSNPCVLKGIVLGSNNMNAKKLPTFFPLVIISLLDSCMVTLKLPPDVAPSNTPSTDLSTLASG